MTTTSTRWAAPPDASRDRWQPSPLSLRLDLLRRRHGLDGPTARTVAALAYPEDRA